MKRPVRIAVIAAASLLGLGVVAYTLRNPVATAIARSAASGVLKVPVEIGWVSIDVWGAAITVEDVKVGNPKGFEPPHALVARRISVDVSGESSTSTLVVDAIELDGVGVWFLLDGTRNNIAELVKGMEGTEPKDTKPAAGGPAAARSTRPATPPPASPWRPCARPRPPTWTRRSRVRTGPGAPAAGPRPSRTSAPRCCTAWPG